VHLVERDRSLRAAKDVLIETTVRPVIGRKVARRSLRTSRSVTAADPTHGICKGSTRMWLGGFSGYAPVDFSTEQKAAPLADEAEGAPGYVDTVNGTR